MTIKVVGVVGAGVMGHGVAQNLAQVGHQVVLVDVSNDTLGWAKKQIHQNLRFRSLFEKSQGDDDADEILRRVKFSLDYTDLAKADYIIENVTEKWDIKKDVYIQLDEIAPLHAVFAANTSAIPVTRLASVTKRPANVLGIHFMNPVPLKPTVEVIRGYHTSEDTITITQQLLSKMGKDWVIVNDAPGFVSNRVLMLTVNEAVYLLQENVASASDVDKIFKQCFGHKMGPLETADLIGLDTILYSLDVLYESFNDSKYRPCPLLKKMVYAGLYGQKSGQGFYKYPSQSIKPR